MSNDMSPRRRWGSGFNRAAWPSAAILTCLVTFAACSDASSANVEQTQDVTSTETTTSVTTNDETTSTTTAPTDTADSEPDSATNQAVDDLGPLYAVDADLEGALLGFSTGLSRAERAPRFRQIEADAGRHYDIGHVFHAWDLAIPTEDDLMHIDEDRLLMISWNGTDTKEIASGQHDEWIRTQAAAVRDLDRPLLLRWLWEMDGNRRRAWVHSGPDYVAAWNHIRNIFDDVGADNAQFVWCPNEFLFWEGGEPDSWYPGDDNVDWICADGYNWADSADSEEWVSLADIFGDFVDWAEARGKPIMIGETGVGEAEPGAKAQWFRDMPTVLREQLPEIDAVVYFDKDFRDFGHSDWRVDTSVESYEAWLEISNDPWLNPLGR